MKQLELKNSGLAVGLVGLCGMFYSLFFPIEYDAYWLLGSFTLMGGGILFYSYTLHYNSSPATKNNGAKQKSLSIRGVWGWLLGLVLTAFYVVLYANVLVP